jgi:hypothetical protein
VLTVDVEREDTIGYLGEGVRVPDFAPKVDHLWLFVRGSDGDLGAAFYANRSREGQRLRRLDAAKPATGFERTGPSAATS